MKYKKNLEITVKRNRDFWTGDYSNNILAKIEIEGHSVFDVWIDVLSPDILPNHEKMFNGFIDNFRFRENLLDDAIPTARPSFGSSAYGAFFGAEMQFGSSGAYSKPFLADISDHKILKCDFSNSWLKKQIEATKYFVENSDGLCGVCIIETMDNLNLAENIFGSKIYMDLIDNPKELLAFFDVALDFNISLIKKQRKYISKYENGYFDIHEIWVRGNTIWLSIDAWNLVGRETFRKLGLFHIQKSIDYFGSAWLHMHNQAMHLLDDVLRLRNLLGIGLLDDPTEPRCFPRLREIQRITKGMPLQINCTKEEFLEGVKNHSLPRDVMYWIDRGVASIEEANKIMEMVYEY